MSGSVAGLTLTGFRASWEAPANLSEASLQLEFDDTPLTGLSAPAETAPGEETWLDLSGRRVTRPQRGVYIVNGRKVCR